MSQQIVSTWDGVQNTNSWVHDGDVERSAVDIVELASSVAGYSAGAQAAADAASGYADTASAAVASIGTAATDAVAAVQSAGNTEINDLYSAADAETSAMVAVGSSWINTLTSSGGIVTSAVVSAGGAQLLAITSAGGEQISLVSAAGGSAIGDLAAVTAAQSAVLVSAGGYQAGLVASAGTATIALVQAEGATQTAAISASVASQVNIATSAAIVATSAATVASSTVSALTSAGSAQIALVNSAGAAQSALVVSTGATQSAAVVSAGGAQITSIGSAGSGQIDAIASAGATQSAAVVSEGGLQVGLVQSAGAAEIEAITSAASDYAKKNGDYPDMTVGNAEQLVSEDYLTDTAPYTFRTAGGNVDIGDREYDELVGGTIAWNQLFTCTGNVNTNPGRGLTASVSEDGKSVTVTGEATSGPYVDLVTRWNSASIVPVGHKYLCVQKSTGVEELEIAGTGGFYTVQSGNGYKEVFGTASFIYQAGTYFLVRFKCAEGVTYNATFTLQVFDLTAMFGTAIADYVYALEQATAGAGVAWFRVHFPKDYYAYDAGTLMSVHAASHDMVGFNQWDEEWEIGNINASGENQVATDRIRSKNYTEVFGGTAYYLNIPAPMVVHLWDASMTYIGNTYHASSKIFTLPANARYLKFRMDTSYGTAYNNDICINLSWSGYRNGEYEPYQKNSYPLDSTLTLRGIPKLDASNNLVYDGDTYEADGTVTRRYGIVDLGTLSWVKETTNPVIYSRQDTMMYGGYLICPRYVLDSHRGLGTGSGINDKSIAVTNSQAIPLLRIKDTSYSSDLDALIASLSGVYLVYELATPTTETADAFQTPQIVNDFGTEQYVDAAVAAGTRDVAIPVGHDTRYMSNLKDKLRRLPNMPDNAGTYLVDYNSTTRRCSFTEYLDGAKVTALEGKVPDAPVSDGTYTLTATVADGEVTYSWVSA